jgi:hypothetical protein
MLLGWPSTPFVEPSCGCRFPGRGPSAQKTSIIGLDIPKSVLPGSRGRSRGQGSSLRIGSVGMDGQICFQASPGLARVNVYGPPARCQTDLIRRFAQQTNAPPPPTCVGPNSAPVLHRRPRGPPGQLSASAPAPPRTSAPASIVISKPPVAVQLPQPDVSANRDARHVVPLPLWTAPTLPRC